MARAQEVTHRRGSGSDVYPAKRARRLREAFAKERWRRSSGLGFRVQGLIGASTSRYPSTLNLLLHTPKPRPAKHPLKQQLHIYTYINMYIVIPIMLELKAIMCASAKSVPKPSCPSAVGRPTPRCSHFLALRRPEADPFHLCRA